MRPHLIVAAAAVLLVACSVPVVHRHWVVEITNGVPLDYVAVVTTELGSDRWLIPEGADSRDLIDATSFPTSAHLQLLDARSCTVVFESDLPIESTSITLDPGFGDQVDLHAYISVKRSLVAGDLLAETATCAKPRPSGNT